MPHYFFRTTQSGEPQTSSSTSWPDDDAAKKEAAGMFADWARDVSERLLSNPDWQIEVANEAGKSVFKIKLTAESSK